ncbi:MAG TPA: hydantoinase B/oxoprolinase family protein [Drouetiella sp.]
MASTFTRTENKKRWQFWIDRGGTFTDIIGLSPEGLLRTEKLLSENPQQYSDAATAGIRKILALGAGDLPSPEQIECVKIGTTVATNALLERKVEPTVLITNKGFGDALRIGYQNRPHIFARRIILPEQLYTKVIEVDCRVDAQGLVLSDLDEDATEKLLQSAFDEGFRACAINLMHGYRHPQHERLLEEIASKLGFKQISVSHKISPLVKLVGRGDTTVADACLSPVLRKYTTQVQKELPEISLLFMQSNGGLAEASHFWGKDSLLSGPAGGVIGAQSVGKLAGFENVIGFDMGGTSTDVSHIAGELERTNDAVVSGVRIKSPMLSINTVAAGGGSVCYFDGQRMRVGPESAGANPGPACYGKDGPLTITDCNLLLGRIQPTHFPRVFGKSGGDTLDKSKAQARVEVIAKQIESETGSKLAPATVAHGFLSIAITKMANAIKQISIEKGHDLTNYALVAFGGAGGQHACQIADALGIKTIVIHPLAGLLSAFGIGTASITSVKQTTLEIPMLGGSEILGKHLVDLRLQAVNELESQGLTAAQITDSVHLHLKYAGTDATIPVALHSESQMKAMFERLHQARFGFTSPEKTIQIESISVLANARPFSADNSAIDGDVDADGKAAEEAPSQICEVFLDQEWQKIPLLTSTNIHSNKELHGPALIADKMSTTFLDTGWSATKEKNGILKLQRSTFTSSARLEVDDLEKPDPIRLELFNHIFMSIAEQMGVALQNTSQSINIKERLDFSCAIFDECGNLVANAPHIPVHLGSMSACVQNIIERRRNDMRPGDSFVSNNPYAGGTHLPDITVISPAFVDDGNSDSKSNEKPAFYLAARGHHADIGGITPGSMPANSKTLDDEGIVIDNCLLVREGKFFETEIADLLKGSQFPARNIPQNIADLKAQVAANIRGANALLKVCNDNGLTTVQRYMRFVQNNSTHAVQAALKKLCSGKFACVLDNGATISVSFEIDSDKNEATLDFSGTSAQLDSNLNAPDSITNAASMYVLRTLIDDDIPLNQGFLTPLKIKIPSNSLLNPAYPAAIVAGNVETSQQITDTIYGALNIMAASQGTMNNFTFGNESVQYYETIAGGSGAGQDFDGASAVQTNMTNSRLTDPEVFEMRFPVILEEFSIRKGSGGKGLHTGGDGVIRKIKFREPVIASILSQRRKIAPHGLNGGSAGRPGSNYVIKNDGSSIELGATATIELESGDTFVIETPGGGGYGISSE